MWIATYYIDKGQGYIQGNLAVNLSSNKLTATLTPYIGITKVKHVQAILKPLGDLP